MEVDLKHKNWYSSENVYVYGSVFFNGDLLTKNETVSLFQDIDNISDFQSKLKQTRGQFSIIVELESAILMTTDLMSTHPLFYSSKVISDEYEYIESSEVQTEMELGTMFGWLNDGKCTFNDTLSPNISRVRAGEIVELQIKNGELTKTESKSIYDVISDTKSNFGDILNRVFSRIKSEINGDSVILPLSGGNDSRLIAYILYQLDFDVYCLCWDTGNNSDELQRSEYIADQLDFEWGTIDMRPKNWEKKFNSKEYKKIKNDVGYYGTHDPHPRTIHVLQHLKNSTQFPDSGYILPGHNPFHAGARHEIPEPWYYTDNIPIEEFTNEFLKYTFDCDIGDRKINELIRKKLEKSIPQNSVSISNEKAIRIFEHWYCKEVCPARTGTHQRIYEEFNYSVWFPYFDIDILSFYFDIPLKKRRRRIYFKNHINGLDEKYLDQTNIFDKQTNVGEKFKNAIINTPIEPIAREINSLLKNRNNNNIKYKNKSLENQLSILANKNSYFNNKYTLSKFLIINELVNNGSKMNGELLDYYEMSEKYLQGIVESQTSN